MWKIIIKNNKRNLIMCIRFLIIGCLNSTIHNKYRFFQFTNVVIGFIPFLVASILLIIFYKNEIRARTKTIINTNMKNYTRIRKLYTDNEMQYFPVEISKYAENIEFAEWVPFMDSGGGMYLSYDIDKENEQKTDEELRSKSKYVLESMEDIKIADKNICLLNKSKIEEAIGYKSYPESSDEFIIYISEDSKSNGDGDWSHGIQQGVIINKDKHRIIYFHEYW